MPRKPRESPERDAAKQAGHQHYAGLVCPQCDSATRYVVNDLCVACIRRSASKHRKVAAKQNADLPFGARFEGNPCPDCGGTTRYRRSYKCVACLPKAMAARWAARPNPADSLKKNRASQLKRNYGVTPEQVELLLISQNGVCAVCSRPEAGGRGDWHVDHCHVTGVVRGLLCHFCNVGIGCLRDSASLLRKAADYLHDEQQAARVFFAREAAWLLSNGEKQ